MACKALEENKPSGLGSGATVTLTVPAVLTVKVRSAPEPLMLLPVALKITPWLIGSRLPELRTPLTRTLSEWNVGTGDVQAYRCRTSEDVYAVLPSW